jgi:hypothetical protein
MSKQRRISKRKRTSGIKCMWERGMRTWLNRVSRLAAILLRWQSNSTKSIRSWTLILLARSKRSRKRNARRSSYRSSLSIMINLWIACFMLWLKLRNRSNRCLKTTRSSVRSSTIYKACLTKARKRSRFAISVAECLRMLNTLRDMKRTHSCTRTMPRNLKSLKVLCYCDSVFSIWNVR